MYGTFEDECNQSVLYNKREIKYHNLDPAI